MLSAAEVSGDVQGAALARELKKIDSDIRLFGMGGEQMAAAGVDIRLDITDTSTIGLLEPIRFIPSHIRSFRAMKALMKNEKPDALLVIDAQGFHMPLVSAARKIGLKTIYYIAPQEWLWGTKKGVRKVVEAVDMIIAVFRREYEAYREAGGKAVYFGHPVVDIAKPSFTPSQLRSSSYVKRDAPFIGLFPGSRRQEIDRLLPVMLDAVKIIESRLGAVNPLLGLSSTKFRSRVEKIVGRRKVDLSIIEGGTYDTLAACEVSIAASGTILLEAAAVGAPVIMTYRLSPLTAFLARHVVKLDRKLKYFAMPNILADEKVIPELIMKDSTPEKIASEAISIIGSEARAEKISRGLKRVAAILGDPGVVSRVAGSVVDFLGGSK